MKSVRVSKLTGSDVSDRIGEEHRRLRRQLVALQELARAVALDESQVGKLRASLRVLLMEVSQHLDSEEEILLPLIESRDVWGHERAARLRHEHVEQRAALRRMFEQAHPRESALALAQEVDGLVLRMFRDMRDEERELLCELGAGDGSSIEMCG